MALNKPLEELTEADLQSLKDQSVPEDQVLDYKKGLFLKADPPKDEFRADVTSFANGIGGHLVIGMDEERGIPTDLCGMEIADQDAFTRQIDEVLQNKITPPVPGYKIRYIPVADGKTAVVIRIPQSYAKPHQITVGKDDYQFYVRNSAGKKRLTVEELRAIILRSESLAEHIRTFKLERLGNIVGDDAPQDLIPGARIVLHMIPFSAFGSGTRFDLSRLEGAANDVVAPLVTQTEYRHVTRRFNLDGYLTHLSPGDRTPAWSYLQVFRSGILEYVEAYNINKVYQGEHSWSKYDEAKVGSAIVRGLALQKMLGVEPPIVVMLTLVGVRGHKIFLGERLFDSFTLPFRRDTMLIPEVVVEDYGTDPDEIIRPLFDVVWNEAGYARCENFDENGKFCPPQ